MMRYIFKTLKFSWIILSIFVLLLSLNPMAVMFITDVSVENTSDKPVWVTLLGESHNQKIEARLPLSLFRWMSFPHFKETSFEIGPKQVRTFSYDKDDIDFTKVIVKTHNNQFFTIDTVNLRENLELADLVKIPSELNKLKESSDQEKAFVQKTRPVKKLFVFYGIFGLGFLFLIFSVVKRVWRRVFSRTA